MGEISTINNSLDRVEQASRSQAQRSQPSKDATPPAPEDASQFTKLSSVLNGLKRGATAMRAQVTQAMTAVKSGSYHVDPIAVSRSIVSDSLAWRR